jgi:hypothetical protein
MFRRLSLSASGLAQFRAGRNQIRVARRKSGMGKGAKRFSARIPLSTLGIGCVLDFGSIRSDIIVI